MTAQNEGRDETIREFHDLVNMMPKQLKNWLATEESKEVGQKSSAEAESTGHESGRNVVRLLDKNRSEYTEDDLEEVRRVRSCIKRHLAQRPAGDVSETRWRHSLMNWGHDPLRN